MVIFSEIKQVAIFGVVVLVAVLSGDAAGKMPSGQKYVNSIGMEFVRIEGGSFSMGSDEGDFDERPVHEVTISTPFYIGRTEVTVEQFGEFRAGYKGKEELEPFASSMSWYDADAFCKWLGVKEGLVYRLPTEAQWELASRFEGPENMQSGVAEWCFDWHGLYRDGAQVDPVGPKKGWMKVVRGGGLDTFKWDETYFRRITNRAAIAPSFSPPTKEYLEKMLKWPDGTSEKQQASYERKVRLLGRHTIGFRVVLGEMPKSKAFDFEAPALMRCVKQKGVMLEQGPDANEPYYKVRRLFPYGLDLVKVGWKVGIEPGVFAHHHNAALAALPNGDLLAFYYNRPLNTGEREPILTIAGLRLRRGAEQWGMPSSWPDFLDGNDEAPLLWNDNGVLWLFWGCPRLREIHPFQWTMSTDNGAKWSGVEFPTFETPLGSYSAQPITSAFRDSKGTMYVGVDGSGESSVLFSSRNNGKTWIDPVGRTRGRHSAFVMIDDETILSYGGKNDHIEGFMPKNVSTDGGRSWVVSKSPVPMLGGGQRPSLIKLASGRLLYVGDMLADDEGSEQFPKAEDMPDGYAGLGGYVGLSNDNGQTWRIKRLAGLSVGYLSKDGGLARDESVGYVMACQSADGLIHVLTTSELHITLNEAWILKEQKPEYRRQETGVRNETRMQYREDYPGGKVRVTYSGGIRGDGRWVLDGKEVWYYESGRKQWEVEYKAGSKVGVESYWGKDGQIRWQWEHGEDGRSVWRVFGNDGKVRAESRWRDKEYLGQEK
jgi:hypothetical protein